MTPREADVALALESCDGVEAVFAVDTPPSRLATPAGSAPYEFSVVLRPRSTGNMARAHTLLLTVLTRAETARVAFVDADEQLQPSYMARARRLVLSRAEREAADQRAAARPRPVD